MNKLEKFYNKLEEDKKGVIASNGEYGYFVTVEELIKNGGRNDLFRKVRKSNMKVSNDVYFGLEYDRTDKGYYANCYCDISKDSGLLKKDTIIFIGFTY